MQPDRTILHALNSLDGGGAERVLVDLLHALADHGDRLSARHLVVTLRQAGRLAPRLPAFVACHALGACGKSRATGLRLARIARRRNAGVLHARGVGCWADALVAKMANPRMSLVLGFHGRTDGHGFRRRDRIVARVACWLGARFATVGEAGAAQLVSELGIPRARIDRLLNGVTAAHFAPDAALREARRTSFGWCDGEFVIGAVGSLSQVKRHDLLIEAFAELASRRTSVRLLIVGEGALRRELESLVIARRLSGRVVFTGYREDLREFLGSMDVYVCSSDSECMSNAVLQALAAGLPAIVTAVGDNAMMVRDGVEGLVIRAGSKADLVRALDSLTEGPARRIELGEAARRRALDFRFSDTVDRYAHYYGSLLATPCVAVETSGALPSLA